MMKSWFWHGRYEGFHGLYGLPDGLMARLLYKFGYAIGVRFGLPKDVTQMSQENK